MSNDRHNTLARADELRREITMAELPLYLLLLALLVAVPFLCLTRSSRRHGCGGGSRLPPSPWALPVIGHLHHVAGALPHRAMRDLARRHGPLMLLRLCELRVVVASTAEAAREVTKTHDLAFATRPITPTGKVLMADSVGVVFAPYGDGWRTLRRICTLELLSARRVRSFRAVREEEVGRLLRAVAAAAAAAALTTPGATAAVNLSERISAYVADSAVRAVIGSRFKNRAAAEDEAAAGAVLAGPLPVVARGDARQPDAPPDEAGAPGDDGFHRHHLPGASPEQSRRRRRGGPARCPPADPEPRQDESRSHQRQHQDRDHRKAELISISYYLPSAKQKKNQD